MDIYVGNLSYDATSDSLRDLFSKFGKIIRANVVTDRETGRSRGFGFVEMEDTTEAQNAIEKLHNQDFMGRKLIVNQSKPRN